MSGHLEIEGIRIPDDPAIITPKIRRSIEAGRYEREERAGTGKFLKPGDRVIELGAGIGFVSSYISKVLGVRDVMCVEADPQLCAFIARVHRENGIEGAEIRNLVALNDGGAPGAVPFYVREPFWSSSLDPDEEYVRRVDVPCERLSALVREFRANVLIVDIEGGERDLFSPADLSGIDRIFLEIHTRKIRRIGIRKCFDALSAAGFAYDQQVSRGGSVLFRRIPRWQLKEEARAGG